MGKILFAYFKYLLLLSHFLCRFYGEVREWLNRPVSKTGISAMVSRVRIPSSPILSRYKVVFIYYQHLSMPVLLCGRTNELLKANKRMMSVPEK